MTPTPRMGMRRPGHGDASPSDIHGQRLPDHTPYPQYCQLPTTAAIPAGADHTHMAQVAWPASAGQVTLYGQLALGNGFLVLPTLNIP
jgi:hypothetical protein